MLQYFPENSSLNGVALALFEAMDRDASGSIDSGEFLHAVWLLQQSKEGSKTKMWNGHPSEIFAHMDTNGNNCLDLDEWMAYLRGMWEALGEKKLRPLLELHIKAIKEGPPPDIPAKEVHKHHHHHHHHHSTKDKKEKHEEEDTIDVALVKAAHAGQAAIIRDLISNDADPNICSPAFGDTPLQIAAIAGKHEAVKALVEGGADLNALNSMGASALMQASSHGYKKVVKALLECKADSNFRNLMGSTALDVAEQANHDDVVQLLRQHGAEIGERKPVSDFDLDVCAEAHLPTTGEVFDQFDLNIPGS